MEEVLQNWVEWLPRLATGAQLTILCTVLTMSFATVLSLGLALARLAHIPVVHQLIVAYVEIFRGLPTVVILFLAYFGLPALGINISDNPLVPGIAGLSLNLAAYLSEVFRAAILAVDPGQMEAALSLGMNKRQGYVRIVLPQAFLVAIPTLGGYFIGTLKDTSLLSFISITELLKTGNDIISTNFLSFQVYVLVGIIYVALSLVTSRMVMWVEHRLRPLERTSTKERAALLDEVAPDVLARAK